MRLITNEELFAVAGGELEMDSYGDGGNYGDGGSGSNDMQVVVTTATQADVQAARNEYFAQNAAGYISAAAGIGAGAIVTGACIGIPAILSGPAAPETVAVLSRPCGYLGGVVATGVGVATSNYLRKALQ